MNITHSNNHLLWYAVYVKSRTEKKVQQALTDNGFEAYVPTRKVIRQWSDRKKKVEIPVINGYAFVRINYQQRLDVLKIPNIVSFVRYQGKDAVIPDNQMEAMKCILNQSELDVNINYESLQPGQKTEIIAGPMMGFQGELTEVKGRKWTTIRLEQINCNFLINIPINQLKIL